MKLTAQQIEAVEQQTGVEPIAEDNPAIPTLKEHFGDHTFYADANGLSILEPMETDTDGHLATVVQLAAWSDDQSALLPHRPMRRDVVIDFEAGGGEAE